MSEEQKREWPRGSRGQPKLFLSDAQADRFIAAGLLTEDDVIRTKPVPLHGRR